MRLRFAACAGAMTLALSLRAGAQGSVPREVTSLVARGTALASQNFEPIVGTSRGGDAYDVPSLKSPDLGWCVFANRPDARTLFCHLHQHGTLKAASAFYLPAIRLGLPASYREIACPSPATMHPSTCRAWSSDGPRHTTVSALVIQGDGGGYGVELDFRNRV
jgi:hypothetical protein